jgi:formylglycine-generating enzyme
MLVLPAMVLGALAAVDVRQPLAAQAPPAMMSRSPKSSATAVANLQELAPASSGVSRPSSCPSDMVEVVGDFCPAPEQICDEFISAKRDRCVRFRQKVRCIGKPIPKHFCIDRYEYPNERGKHPTVSVTWDEARDLCANEGKRLCGAEEWTLACEGVQLKPYPFGYTRDATACNIDKPYLIPDNVAYDDPRTRAEEISRVSQSEPSGVRQRCVSDYGVYDMTGNVDEWVLNERGTLRGPEFQSGLKGGYWGPVRNRCRPTTTDHNHWHHGYQIGFRCCKASVQFENLSTTDLETTAVEMRDEWDSPEASEPSTS